jgi:hypothetical protein
MMMVSLGLIAEPLSAADEGSGLDALSEAIAPAGGFIPPIAGQGAFDMTAA